MDSFYVFGGIPLLAAALASSVCNALMIWVSRRLDFVDRVSDHTYHDRPRPLGGGVGLFLSMTLVIGTGLGIALFLRDSLSHSILSNVSEHVEGVHHRLADLGIMMTGALIFFLLGLVDDIRDLGPFTKLPVQIIGASIVVFGGFRFSLFLEQGGRIGQIVQYAVTILWILVVTNAMNFLDNMDGQCAGISAVISLLLGVLAFQTNQLFLGSFLFVIAGACSGFLVFNFPPAQIFAGDSGSLLLGYCLAISVIQFTFFRIQEPGFVYFSPFFLFVVPFYDSASVVWLRFREERSLVRGDTSHFSHRLVERGLSERGALLVVMLMTALTGLFSLVIYQTNEIGASLLVCATILLLVLINLLENTSG